MSVLTEDELNTMLKEELDIKKTFHIARIKLYVQNKKNSQGILFH